MKKILMIFSLITLLFLPQEIRSQAYETSWTLNFGATYPRMISTNAEPDFLNYGVYAGIQKNFSESVGFRWTGRYIQTFNKIGASTRDITIMIGQANLIYKFAPYDQITPYLQIGGGGFLSTVTNVDAGRPNDAILDFFLDLGAGMEFKLWPRFSFNAEVSFQSGQSQYMDGSPGTGLGGILGQNADTWATLDVGWVWYFSTGDSAMPANVMYAGIRDAEMPDPVDYDRIEQIVKDNVPREVIKEVVVPVEKESDASSRMSSDDNWVLVGLNYDFGSARLSQEAYPILFHAALVMLKNPDMKVEIQGHTDNIGSEKYNQKLSLDRAKAVKNYLIARGVDARRMQVVGYGSKFPIADNKTAVGRSMNRRIEFKTLN